MTLMKRKQYMVFLVLISWFVNISSEGATVKIQTCQNKLKGQPCRIICTVPDFQKPIVIFHPPKDSVAFCKVNGKCISDYLMESKAEKNQIILAISRLNDTHSGYWKCSYGTLESEYVFLTIYELPDEKPPALYLSATRGKTVRLFCDLTPLGDSFGITWLFNGIAKELGGKYSLDSVDNSTFIIDDIQDVDEGVYQCEMAVPKGSTNIKTGRIINLHNIEESKDPKQNEKNDVFPLVTLLLSLTLCLAVFVCISFLIWKIKCKGKCLNKDRATVETPMASTSKDIDSNEETDKEETINVVGTSIIQSPTEDTEQQINHETHSKEMTDSELYSLLDPRPILLYQEGRGRFRNPNVMYDLNSLECRASI